MAIVLPASRRHIHVDIISYFYNAFNRNRITVSRNISQKIIQVFHYVSVLIERIYQIMPFFVLLNLPNDKSFLKKFYFRFLFFPKFSFYFQCVFSPLYANRYNISRPSEGINPRRDDCKYETRIPALLLCFRGYRKMHFLRRCIWEAPRSISQLCPVAGWLP